ncbi:uncharacterized protein LOC132195835 [Neocloeon triangulifer]|uniref:uncharacterized protein LOC132195835 n=1 Tax=Neocloeon triangulifer TaxID=2078957 RepID=UPI00286F9F18|nr:uncharacterized protein LOC132195835 [Neocloeon triangulifer]
MADSSKLDELEKRGISPNGPANLGYFENNQNADDACVLVVSYEFNATMKRKGNEVDLVNLRKSFKDRRKCQYKELESPTAEFFLEILKNEEVFLKLFEISSVPSAFFLFILSHGTENNVIVTNFKDQNGEYKCFLTTQVVEAIKKSPNLREQLNVIFFGPCRGKLDDEAHKKMKKPEDIKKFKNQTSSRVTNMPGDGNFVIVYSTVETTLSIRDTEKGTLLVKGITQLLDNLENDELLEVLLTKFQHLIHGMLEWVGQTPEIKYTPHRKFVIRAVKRENDGILCETDGKGNTRNVFEPERSAFFQRCKESEKDVHEKWAMIFGAKSGPFVQRTEKALHENLGFRTEIHENTSKDLNSVYEKTQGEQSKVFCILAVFFAPLFLNKENEVCVRIGETSTKIGDIVYKFLGPGNEMWIGRPKLFFFVNETIHSDNILTDQKFDITATNHSGTFICILKSSDSADELIRLFNNPKLRNGTSIQELALDLIRKERNKSGEIISQIVSTLPFLVDLPMRPNTFVAPRVTVISNNISATDPENEIHDEVRASSSESGRNKSKLLLKRQELNEKHFTFNELKQEMKRQLLGSGKQDYCVWLFSSLPGSGKSTVLHEIASSLNREQPDKKVFTVQLQQLYSYFSDEPELNIVEVLSKADKMNHDLQQIKQIVKEGRAIVFLDGFDEICPNYRNQVLELIKIFTDILLPLVIATRPEEEDTILNSLQGLSTRKIKIKPLKRKDQQKLLMKLGKSEEECEELFKLFEKSGTSEILANPFHLTLACGTQIVSIGGIFGIYMQVIERKVEEALKTEKERTEPSKCKKNERMKILMDLALRLLVNDNCSISHQLTDADINLINNSGVASILEKKTIHFVHQTFAEFLVALRFIHEIKRKSNSEIPIFQNIDLRQCRVFIDSYLSQQRVPFRDNLKHFLNRSKNVSFHRILAEQLNYIVDELKPLLKSLLDCKVNERDENGNSLLTLAASFSSAEMCRFLVENGADLSVVDKFGDDSLHLACFSGKLDTIKYLLGLNGFSVEKKGWKGRTALHWAAAKGHIAVAEFLLSQGADVNTRDDDNESPLTLAASFSSAEMCRFLVENGADLSVVDKFGDDSLHLACFSGKLDTIKYLLGLNGFSVEKKGWKGRTALHWAAAKGHIAVAEFLLSQGADVNTRDDDNESPLTLAASFSSAEMCQFLVENGADLSAVNEDGNDSLHLACLNGKLDNVKYLLGLNGFSVEKKNWKGRTALHLAAAKGHIAVAEFLLSQGAEVNARDDDNETPLTLAASFSGAEMCQILVENGADLSAVDGRDSLKLACFLGKMDKIKYFLELNGFSVEKKGWKGRTALHRAAENGQIAVAEFLLSQGADVNSRDDANDSPLTLAASFSSAEMCRFLVENGAYFGGVDKDGNDSLHLACLNGKLDNIKYFLGLNGFTVETKDRWGRTALHLAAAKGHIAVAEFLLSQGAEVNARDDDNETPLTLAASFSGAEMCQFLVENGADLSGVDEDGNDSLHLACLNGKLDNVKYLLGLNGFSVEKKNWKGRTALHLAAAKGHIAVAEFLLSQGADVNSRDDAIESPSTLAASFSGLEMCQLLVENGTDLSAVDEDGNDSLHLACFSGKLDTIKYLLGLNGFSVENKGRNGRTALHIAAAKGHIAVAEFLLSQGADVNSRDDANDSPLTLAASFSSAEMCRFLVENGADLSVVDKDGNDSLHLACFSGKLDNVKYLLGLNGFSVEKKGWKGRTAFHLAAAKGHIAEAEFLLSQGADVNTRDDANESPLTLAASFSSAEMCQFLVENGADLSAVNEDGNDSLHLACYSGRLDNAKFCLD